MEDKKEISSRNMARVGLLLKNYSVVLIVYIFLAFFSLTIYSLKFVILIVLTVLSFGLVFINDNLLNFLSDSKLTDIINAIYLTLPYAIAASVVLSVLSVIFTSFNPRWTKANNGRMVSVAVLVLSVLFAAVWAILYFGFGLFKAA